MLWKNSRQLRYVQIAGTLEILRVVLGENYYTILMQNFISAHEPHVNVEQRSPYNVILQSVN